MERGWIETVQMLGLDMMVALVVLGFATLAAVRLLAGLAGLLRRALHRRPRVLATSPRDAYATEEWGPSH